MGYDISYHPVKERELREWYFDLDLTKIVEGDYSEVEQLCTSHGIDPHYLSNYKGVMNAATNVEPDATFDNTHGYYAAVVQGFFKRYFYTRGSAFSFLMQEQPAFRSYTKGWEEIISDKYSNKIFNHINLNYSSGVYIPADEVRRLLNDYETNATVKNAIDNFYSHGRVAVFLKALRAAVSNDDGLLEATEVIEPNPLDLNSSKCYSNLMNCDVDGALLYRDAAAQQMAEIEQREGLAKGEIARQGNYEQISIPPPPPATPEKPEKKGFFKKLFG